MIIGNKTYLCIIRVAEDIVNTTDCVGILFKDDESLCIANTYVLGDNIAIFGSIQTDIYHPNHRGLFERSSISTKRQYPGNFQ